MSDRIAVMNRGVIEQLDVAGGGLRAPAHRVRGRLHRRVEPDARRGSCRSTGDQAELRLDSGVDGARAAATASRAGRALPRGRAPGEARRSRGSRSRRRGDRPSVEGLVESSRSTSAPRRRWSCGSPATCALTVLVPERRRGRAPAAARARARGCASAGRREHMHVVPRGGGTGAGRATQTEDRGRHGRRRRHEQNERREQVSSSRLGHRARDRCDASPTDLSRRTLLQRGGAGALGLELGRLPRRLRRRQRQRRQGEATARSRRARSRRTLTSRTGRSTST